MKIKILSLAIAGILLVSFSFTPQSNAKSVTIKNRVVCQPVTLTSPPSTLEVGSAKICENTLTVSTTGCAPFTFTFTWGGATPGTYVKSTATGSGVLKFNLPSTATGTISLVVADCCGNSSGTYNFTATSCR